MAEVYPESLQCVVPYPRSQARGRASRLVPAAAAYTVSEGYFGKLYSSHSDCQLDVSWLCNFLPRQRILVLAIVTVRLRTDTGRVMRLGFDLAR